MLHLAVAMGSVPSDYFRYYYFGDEQFREAQAQRRTRAGVLLDALPGYWEHYAEQADADVPELDPNRSRGGIHELELAIDVMSAYYNDTPARLPVNLPNIGGALPGFDEDTVVEIWCDVDATGAHPLPQQPLPHAVRGHHPDARGVPAARGRGRLGGQPRRCRTGARRPPVRPQPARRRGALRRPRVREPRLPAGASPAMTRATRPVSGSTPATPRPWPSGRRDPARVLGFGRAGNGDIYGAATEPLAVAVWPRSSARCGHGIDCRRTAGSRIDTRRSPRPRSAWPAIDWSPTTSSGARNWMLATRAWPCRCTTTASRCCGRANPTAWGWPCRSGTGGAVVARGPGASSGAPRSGSRTRWVAGSWASRRSTRSSAPTSASTRRPA